MSDEPTPDLPTAARDLLNQLTLLRMPDQSRLWQLGGAPMEAAYQALKRADAARDARPTIVCLCGSTRFWRTFQQASLAETMAGRIVLSIGAASGTDDEHFGNLPRDEYDRVKAMLDALHMRKIDIADEILVLNVDGYVGESTARELAYARKLGKPVRFLEAIPMTDQPNIPELAPDAAKGGQR